MKTHNHLYHQIHSFSNLLEAHRLAARGKRLRGEAAAFGTRLENELLKLGRELEERSYRPGGYRTKVILRPKKRMISAAPFRDRVVHHALCRVAMPCFERKMIHDLYSNRAGKGTHAAIRRAQHYARRYRYALKCDVSKFFPSMDHEVLKQRLRRTVRCRNTLWLFDRIIDASNPQEPVWSCFPGEDLAEAGHRRVGLPLGNLTSQWFGGIYLADFDHWVKETLGCGGYLRYVEDFLLFGDDKRRLGEWRAAVVGKLAEYRLRANDRKTRIFTVREGISFLGQRIWPHRRRILRPNVTAARRRLRWNVRQYQRAELSREELVRRWESWRGHARQADAESLIENMRKELKYALGTAG